jgi:hypothetical protein
MPWIEDLGLARDGQTYVFMLFNMSKRKAEDLKLFTYKVGNNGYIKNGKGIVDHAVASGLLLLQYSTYWFWLLTNIKRAHPQAYDIMRGLFTNPNYNIIVDACRATAYHNIELSNIDEKFYIHEEYKIFTSSFSELILL